MNINKAIEISDARIQFVSLVDEAANMRTFLITKGKDGSAEFSTYGKILKVNDETHYITGIVYEPMVEDAHGNYMTEEEIQKAAYWFAKNGDQVDLQHSFEAVEGIAVVENYIAPSDMQVGGTLVSKGTWMMTAEVINPEVWKAVQRGEITGFSMGGIGRYSEEDVKLSQGGQTATQKEKQEKLSLFKRFGAMLGFDVVEKGTLTERHEIETIGFSNGTQSTEISAQADKAKGKDSSSVKSINKEEKQVDKQEIQQMAREAVKKALDERSTVEQTSQREAQADTVEKAEKTEAMIREMVEQTVTKAIQPILAARGVPSNLNDTNTTVEKTADIFQGLFV